MLNKDGIRELVYVARVTAVQPIEGKDRVECAIVGGWTCMVPKGAFQPGDLGVYHEIDSKCPEKEPYLFLEKRHYKVKTQKFKNFYSQGLLMPASDFGWVYDKTNDKILNGGEGYGEGYFLTEALGVTYYDPNDVKRKGKSVDKYQRMAQRMGKRFSKQPYRWLMKRSWGRKLLYLFFGRKTKDTAWPAWVKKTDEERCQNLPMLFPGDNTDWIVTEKIDGTSTTFTLIKTRFGWEYYVCSRNVCFDTKEKADKCFYESNYYLEMSEKYDVRDKALQLHKQWFGENPKAGQFVTIQGETFGPGVQNRYYDLREREMNVFNLIFGVYNKREGVKGVERLNPIAMQEMLDPVGLPSVPIIDAQFRLPATCAELLEIAEGESKIDEGDREGLVFRTYDGVRSFKAVSNSFLLRYHK